MKMTFNLAITLMFAVSVNMVSHAQKNGGFEDWSNLEPSCYQGLLDTIYFVDGATSGDLHHWVEDFNGAFFCGTARTTDSHSGDYALMVHNWYAYAWGYVTSHDTISYRPTYLTGFYKYDNEPGAQGEIHVAITKYNGIENDTIGVGILYLDGQSSYTAFQVEIIYDDAFTVPDSIHIRINSSYQMCAQEMVCNLLYVDDLMLSTSATGINEKLNEIELLVVFPNPFSEHTRIKIPTSVAKGEVQIFNSQGQMVRNLNLNGQQEVFLNRGDLSPGLYLIQVLEGGIPIGSATLIAE